jgi:hypothetical protein
MSKGRRYTLLLLVGQFVIVCQVLLPFLFCDSCFVLLIFMLRQLELYSYVTFDQSYIYY